MRKKPMLACIALVTFASAANGEMVDNPVYQSWAACKPGTTQTMKLTGDRAGVDRVSVEKLVEVMPGMVVLSAEITGGNGPAITVPEVIPARIEKNLVGIPPRLFLTVPKVADSREAKEKLDFKAQAVEILTRSFKVEVTSGDKVESGQMKLWMWPEVPGGVFKVEVQQNPDKTMSMTVVDYKKAAVATVRPPEELDDRTPLGLMRRLDRGLPDGGMALATSLNHAKTADGKSFAEASARLNFAVSKLEKAARDRFGGATLVTDDIDHLVGIHGCSRLEIETTNVEITGDKAQINFGENGSGDLIKVDGRWRFDADAVAAGLEPAMFRLLLQLNKDSEALADRLTKELAEGKYKSEEDLKRTMITEVDKITPAPLK